jgi:glutamate racemase
MQRVLVFDSGVGGLSVYDAIARSGQALALDYLADTAWLPYGEKSDEALRERVPVLLAAVAAQWCPDLVVVACNTASTIALDAVRARIAVPVVGVVPPIKPAAALTKTGVIGLLATPATVRRPYTDYLVATFASSTRVIRFGSSALVLAAEAKLRGEPVDNVAICEAVAGLFAAPGGDAIDVVALACTHFPFLAEELAAAAPCSCAWLDSGDAIARRVGALLNPAHGAAQPERVAFTRNGDERALAPALQSRGLLRAFSVDVGEDFAIRSR